MTSMPAFIASNLGTSARSCIMQHVACGPILAVDIGNDGKTLLALIRKGVLAACGPSGGSVPFRYSNRPKFTALTEFGREIACEILESEITRLLKRGCGEPDAMPMAIAPDVWTAMEEHFDDTSVPSRALTPA
ncbi:MAG: hypothetical protein JSS57_07650 [Proteobacteria bacterium]|nr:hypothetical protein [Pseudomonadota bacterium]